MAEYKGIYDYRRIIADERMAYEFIRKVRWPKGIKCPRCESVGNRHFNEQGIPKHQCKKCNYKFSDTTGTIFQSTKLPLTKWVAAIALFRIGISALQLSKEIAISYRIAWKLMHKLRNVVDDPLLNQMCGKIEIDETYYGGREHRHRKYGKTGFKNKTPVIGIRSRDGKVKTIASPNLQSQKIKQILKEHIEAGSVLYTDDHKLHRKFGQWGFTHKKINKLFGFLVKPDVHTNSIEGYWMLSKNKLYARHHQMSKKYLPKYLAECDYKFNNRNQLDPIKDIIQRLIFTPLSE